MLLTSAFLMMFVINYTVSQYMPPCYIKVNTYYTGKCIKLFNTDLKACKSEDHLGFDNQCSENIGSAYRNTECKIFTVERLDVSQFRNKFSGTPLCL